MLNLRLIKPITALALFVSLLFVGQQASALTTPTTNDSNRKIFMNTNYSITWQSILDNYKGPNAPVSLRIKELTLHGELSGAYLYQEIPVQYSGELFNYTPDYDFHGADHFKYQIFDGYSYSNISSYNLDIICPEDMPFIHVPGNHNDYDNNNNNHQPNYGVGGGGSINIHDSSNNYGFGSPNYGGGSSNYGTGSGGDNYGTGGGGDNFITRSNPVGAGGLIRTGGYGVSN